MTRHASVAYQPGDSSTAPTLSRLVSAPDLSELTQMPGTGATSRTQVPVLARAGWVDGESWSVGDGVTGAGAEPAMCIDAELARVASATTACLYASVRPAINRQADAWFPPEETSEWASRERWGQ
jgi:hypothetical protein